MKGELAAYQSVPPSSRLGVHFAVDSVGRRVLTRRDKTFVIRPAACAHWNRHFGGVGGASLAK